MGKSGKRSSWVVRMSCVGGVKRAQADKEVAKLDKYVKEYEVQTDKDHKKVWCALGIGVWALMSIRCSCNARTGFKSLSLLRRWVPLPSVFRGDTWWV